MPALAGRHVVILSKNAVEAEAIARTVRAHGGIGRHRRHRRPGRSPCRRLRHAAGRRGAGSVGRPAAQASAAGRLRARRGDHADRADRPRHARRIPRQRLRDLPGAAGARRDAAAEPCSDGREPRHPAEAGKPPAAKPATRRGHAPAGLSILLAEDNDINAMLARATLVKAGHRVDVVGNGKAAVDAVTVSSHARYDVVLMDLHMPVMDGLDAIARDPPPRGGPRHRAGPDHGAFRRQPGKDPPSRACPWRQRLRDQAARPRRPGPRRRGTGRRLIAVAAPISRRLTTCPSIARWSSSRYCHNPVALPPYPRAKRDGSKENHSCNQH